MKNEENITVPQNDTSNTNQLNTNTKASIEKAKSTRFLII